MPSYLVDTNIWSESLKRKPNSGVVQWLRDNERQLYLSSITLGELKFGIERLPKGRRQLSLQAWISELKRRMRGRVLSYNASVANVWGQLQARCEREGTSLPSADSMIAATALRHSLIIATRNVEDFKYTGVKVENPFEFR